MRGVGGGGGILVLMLLRLNELLKMVTGSKSTYYITCNANSTRRVTGVPYVWTGIKLFYEIAWL